MKQLFTIAEQLKLRNGNNVYSVKSVCNNHILIECVYFCNTEDTGDGILCTYENQQLWIAKYHAQHLVSA